MIWLIFSGVFLEGFRWFCSAFEVFGVVFSGFSVCFLLFAF